jgi:ubiquinone/menaquinone biosynthesis C-methylase UbiE
MEIIHDKQELKRYLKKIENIFDISKLLDEKISNDEIINYYKKSEAGYRIFHSEEGSIHMALNSDGEFDKNGYFEQAKFVNELLENNKHLKILELGSGKGFNSIYLAENNPEKEFKGIDLSPYHIEISNRKKESLENLSFSQADFQTTNFNNNEFDLIFEVESICHAQNMDKTLMEVYRILKKNGKFVLFDGFRTSEFELLDEDLKKAAKLTEISMAVNNPIKIDEFCDLAKNIGFSLLQQDNISNEIIPNLKKFQILARGYFKYPKLSKVFLDLFSDDFVMNSIAGLLMPFTIMGGAQGYYRIVLTK